MEVMRLKEVLNQKGVSGKDLAERVGVTPVTISNIAQNNSFPKPELLLAIARELDVDVRELFYPTKDGALINGFVEYQGRIHRVLTENDLEVLLKLVKEKS